MRGNNIGLFYQKKRTFMLDNYLIIVANNPTTSLSKRAGESVCSLHCVCKKLASIRIPGRAVDLDHWKAVCLLHSMNLCPSFGTGWAKHQMVERLSTWTLLLKSGQEGIV